MTKTRLAAKHGQGSMKPEPDREEQLDKTRGNEPRCGARLPYVPPVIETFRPSIEGPPPDVIREWSGESLRESSLDLNEMDKGAAQAAQLPCEQRCAVDGDRMARMTHGSAAENTGPPLLPSRRDDLHVEELDGEAVLYDPRIGAIHRFNATTFSVWNACDGSCTSNEIAVSLAKHFSVETDEALRDVGSVIGRLDEDGFLNKEPSGTEDIGQAESHPTLCQRCVDNLDGEGEQRLYA